MPKEQKRERWNKMPVSIPSAANLMHDQNLALQNATRMTGQVCHQVISMNKAWFKLWSTLMMDLAALPRHFASAQVSYAGDVLSSFEETGREMGDLVLHAEGEIGETLQKSAEEAGRSIRERSEALEQAAGALQSTANSRRQKSEGGKGRRTEQSSQGQAH